MWTNSNIRTCIHTAGFCSTLSSWGLIGQQSDHASNGVPPFHDPSALSWLYRSHSPFMLVFFVIMATIGTLQQFYRLMPWSHDQAWRSCPPRTGESKKAKHVQNSFFYVVPQKSSWWQQIHEFRLGAVANGFGTHVPSWKHSVVLRVIHHRHQI